MKDYITIFTPTYNRAKLIQRCYESLLKQTSMKFVWLIIDDGSNDNTRDVISKLKLNSPFQIDYYYKKNGGKPSAYNYAINICKTKYFLILDSDDILCQDAIKILTRKIDLIKDNHSVSGIIGNRGRIDSSEVIGTLIPDVGFASGIDLYQKYKFKGDTLRLYKTEIIKQYPFPIIKGEKFIPENVVFDAIDVNYKMLVINEILYLGEYQENGYSNNINIIRHNNPIGYSLSLKSASETAVVLKKKINWTILYIIWTHCFSIKSFKSYKYKLRYILLIPVSYLFLIMKKPSFLFKSINIGEKDGK